MRPALFNAHLLQSVFVCVSGVCVCVGLYSPFFPLLLCVRVYLYVRCDCSYNVCACACVCPVYVSAQCVYVCVLFVGTGTGPLFAHQKNKCDRSHMLITHGQRG